MSTISVHLYDNMTEPAGDDSFDRMCIDCLSSDDLVTEADADLSRWDYLTRTFDNDGFFMDCDMLVQQQQGRVLLLVTDNAIEEVEKEDLEPLPWDVGSVVALEHGTRGTSIQASLQSASKGFPTLSVPASASHKESDDDIPHMMCKPLSAYNYFFRVERDNIVLGMKENDILPPPNCDFSPQKRRLLLHQRWHIDPNREKRAHKKKHGKIDFVKLTAAIAHRWHTLPESGRAFYELVAQADRKQYGRYLEIRRRRQDEQWNA